MSARNGGGEARRRSSRRDGLARKPLHTRTITFDVGDALVEYVLGEPVDYFADVVDDMVERARAKLARDAPPPDELSALDPLLDELEHRARVHRAAAAGARLTGARLR